MNRIYSSQQSVPGIIRYSCAVLFALFSFCYLFFLQGEILAEAQFVFSKGMTTYNILIGAIIITVVLMVVQWVTERLSCLPDRWHALSYFPSMLLLAVLTDVDRPTLVHFSFGAWLWIFPLLLVVYVLLVLLVKRVSDMRWGYHDDIKTQVYPNFIVLFLLMVGVGAIPQSTDVFHYELKAERLVMAADWEDAAKVGEQSLRTSARLTQLRMYALARQGQLAERLFDYPQLYGSRGLLDVADTRPEYRVGPQHICLRIGGLCGQSVHSSERFCQLLLQDTTAHPLAADYYLCGLLLDRRMKDFLHELPRLYNLADSVVGAYDRLPRAYREALLMASPSEAAREGILILHRDTVATFSDQTMVERFRRYHALKSRLHDRTERVNQTHRQFGNTFWWYYDFSQSAQGELQVEK